MGLGVRLPVSRESDKVVEVTVVCVCEDYGRCVRVICAGGVVTCENLQNPLPVRWKKLGKTYPRNGPRSSPAEYCAWDVGAVGLNLANLITEP